MSDLPRLSRGEIWDVSWDPPRGSEQAGSRPSLIVQNDLGNRSPRYHNTIIVALSAKGLPDFPAHVLIKPSRRNGLKHDSYVKSEQVMTISKERLVGKRRRGRLTDEEMEQVDAALRRSLAL